VTQLISDLFEREALRQEVSREGVAQAVRAAGDAFDSDRAKTPPNDCRDAVFPTWSDVSPAALGDSLDLGHRESTDYFGDPRMHA
jgi:hypothetical protein